jgi:hypothetical protein
MLYDTARLPVWDPDAEMYVDPDNGTPLTTWDQALDALGDDAAPAHVVWLGKVDAKGVRSGSKDAERTIRYVTKYIAKDLTETVRPAGDRQRAHFDRLHDELRHLPCTPRCPNWLLYGIQPQGADGREAGPGQCRGKVHRRQTLGFTGRRVLVSRQWANKTLTDIRADNRAWVRALLAVGAENADGDATPPPAETQGDDPGRYFYEVAREGDPDVPPARVRIMRAIAARNRWRNELDAARRRRDELSATDQAA